MAKSEYDDEFESLGVDDVQKRVSAAIWSEAKTREARTWLSSRESRIARSQSRTQKIAMAATVALAIVAIIRFVLSLFQAPTH